MRKLSRVLLVSIAALAIACGGSGGGGKTKKDYAREFLAELNYFANFSSYYDLIKTYTVSGDGWIVVEDDFGSWAINIYDSARFVYLDFEDYFVNESIAIDSSYVNVFGEIIYVDVFGFEYSADKDSQKDLFKVKAKLEEIGNQDAAKKIALKFGLSEPRGLEIAEIANNYSKILKSRTMTDADIKALSKTVLGVDADKIEAAKKLAQSGDESGFDDLLIDASAFNGSSSPEAFRKGILGLMKN